MTEPTTRSFAPDYAIAPGETLREKLAEIGMSQSELASRANLSPKHVNQIVAGSAPITHETALAFERITGVPARIWNALEAAYRDALARKEQRDLTSEDRAWMASLPLNALRKRGFLPAGVDEATTFESLLSFFGVADRRAWERIWLRPVASFKRSPAFRSDPGAMAAWLRAGQLRAQQIDCAPYDAAKFRKVLRAIRALTKQENFGDELKTLCASAGVAFVFMPEIGSCRANGAAHWVSPSKAVIQVSDRHKRYDVFWFAFFHEAIHILHHSKKETFISEEDAGDLVEAEANELARAMLIPPEFARQLPSLGSHKDIRDFAERIGIHASIVAGRLAKEKIGNWNWPKVSELRPSLQLSQDK